MRTRTYYGTTDASGHYTFPQPIRARRVKSVLLTRNNSGTWHSAQVWLLGGDLSSLSAIDPTQSWIVPEGVQVEVDHRDSLIFGFWISVAEVAAVGLMLVEEV